MTGAGVGGTRPHLRNVEEAKLCRYLGNRLTREEVIKNQLMGCRTCNNEIRVHHCSNSVFGPFTFPGGQCTSCTGYNLPIALAADIAESATVTGPDDK